MGSLLFYFIVYIRCLHLITKDHKLFSATYNLCSKKIGNKKIGKNCIYFDSSGNSEK